MGDTPVQLRSLPILTACSLFAGAVLVTAQRQEPGRDVPRYQGGVDMVSLTATVSDSSGRFVRGLTADDFVVYEDDQPQELTYFSAERVPVSLGLILDTSGSMAGDKIDDARSAIDRFIYDLLDPGDELFMYRFADRPVLLQDWTTDRNRLSRAMGRITPDGGTALYDAVLEAIPFAATGHFQKKALVLISDGNDTSSQASLREVRDRLHDSEVLLYAIGIDGDSIADRLRQPQNGPFPRNPPRGPSPFPPGRFPGAGPGGRYPYSPQVFGPGSGGRGGPGGGGPRRGSPSTSGDDRVNATALRELTDDSGGRTEIIRTSRDLNPATASIADELSRQYAVGYASTSKKDGRWHTIRVEIRNHDYRVRTRRGYFAS